MVQLTSREATYSEAMTILQVMFGSDENHAFETLTNAWDNLGKWTGNDVVSVKCMSHDGNQTFVYLIRYRYFTVLPALVTCKEGTHHVVCPIVCYAHTERTNIMELTEMTASHPTDPNGCGGEFCDGIHDLCGVCRRISVPSPAQFSRSQRYRRQVQKAQADSDRRKSAREHGYYGPLTRRDLAAMAR